MSTTATVDTLGARIRKARLAAGYSSHDRLAAVLGTSRQTVIGWEKHGRVPSVRYRALLIDTLADPSLFDGVDDGEPSTVAPFAMLDVLIDALTTARSATLSASPHPRSTEAAPPPDSAASSSVERMGGEGDAESGADRRGRDVDGPSGPPSPDPGAFRGSPSRVEPAPAVSAA